MIVIGLTGSIGMGKSATARMFAAHGIPVHDADAAVHALYDKGGAAVAPVEAAFPGVTLDGRIDRARLSRQVVGKPEALARLEAIVHPLVASARDRFIDDARAARARMAMLEVPLLMETDGDKRCDVVIVASAPASVQRERVLARDGMTAEKFDAILAKQMSDEDKRARAHFIVDTSHGFADAERQVADIVRALSPLQKADG